MAFANLLRGKDYFKSDLNDKRVLEFDVESVHIVAEWKS